MKTLGKIAAILVLFCVTSAYASPLIPNPYNCDINIVFDGWLGCIPLFHLEVSQGACSL